MEDRQISYIVSMSASGLRLDKYLSYENKEFSRNFCQSLIEKGRVLINDEIITLKKYRVEEGDKVTINIPKPSKPEILPENIHLDIVYEDRDILVIDKPAGMVVHPAPGNYDGTLVNGIMYYCGENLSGINGVMRPGIVHRIDKDTSGLLLVAKTDGAHRKLAEMLAKHSIKRVYKAIVADNIKEDEGRIVTRIGRSSKDRKKMAVLTSGGREAVTNWRVTERFGRYTLIEARLETGRTHQIRVHMAYIKHPLLGDIVYGGNTAGSLASRQMLHAESLGFIHPERGNYMEFQSPLPQDFERVLKELRRNGKI